MTHNATTAGFWIQHLRLSSHPEGGYFRQTYASELNLATPGFNGPRPASTAIYFLLEKGNFSAFHRIKSDELWHFYLGDPLEVLVLKEGSLETLRLGPEPNEGQNFQAVVKAGHWFASRVAEGGSFALVGCTVSPGFGFEDFELGAREKLVSLYPQHATLIHRLTRP